MKSLANIKLSLLDHSDSRHHISGTSPPKSAAAVSQYLFNFYSAEDFEHKAVGWVQLYGNFTSKSLKLYVLLTVH